MPVGAAAAIGGLADHSFTFLIEVRSDHGGGPVHTGFGVTQSGHGAVRSFTSAGLITRELLRRMSVYDVVSGGFSEPRADLYGEG
jgi:hypothetical protein